MTRLPPHRIDLQERELVLELPKATEHARDPLAHLIGLQIAADDVADANGAPT